MLSLETGLTTSTISYLTTRFNRLEEREKIVSVMGDEIYTSKRAEFSGGTFYGFELGEPTKTMLCLMLKSVAGPFKDMVAMIPLVKIDSLRWCKQGWHMLTMAAQCVASSFSTLARGGCA